MDDIFTAPDPGSDAYFNELASLIAGNDGLSPTFATQWLTLAQAVVTLRTIIADDLDAVRAELGSLVVAAARWAYGNGQIGIGDTTVSITHSLAGTPATVIISPTCALAGADLWHETPDDAQFTVVTSVAPAAPVTFDWLAALSSS